MSENRRLVLAKRPVGTVADDDFELRPEPIPEPGDGEFVAKVCWLSFDPAQRGWMNDVPSYIPPVQIGEPMRAWGVGEVISSRNDAFPVGLLVSGRMGWQEYALLDASPEMGISVIPPGVPAVRVSGIVEADTPPAARYEPGNPLADAKGYVYAPNVNVVEEMVDMISASRSYQNNVEVMNTSKDMLLATLRLGQ